MPDYLRVSLRDVLRLVDRTEQVDSEKSYRQMGVRLWGQGAYEREGIQGVQTKYGRLSRVETNDVVVNKIWARHGSIAVVPAELSGCFVSAEFPTFAPDPAQVDPHWFDWLTKSKYLWNKCDEKSHGTSGKNRIRPEEFLSIEIMVPPLDVQRRIGKRLDFVKSAIHRLNDGNVENTQKLRRAILQKAISGKLVPQDPEDEPASELLKKIEAEKESRIRERRMRKEKVFPPVSNEEIPYGKPQGWEWVRFGEVTICKDGERIPISEDERELRAKIYDYYGASGVIDKIDDYLFDKDLLLIGEDGANLVNRSTPIAYLATGKYWVNNHAHVLDSVDLAVLKFLEIYINAIDLKPYVTGTAQPKMNQSKMNSIPVAFPPFAEQKRIVYKVEALMKLCDQIERKVSDNQKNANLLMDEVLREALGA
ncbi:MAG: restriction endonuclease subunit S [Candidatus Limnocylindrales bacterium]